MARLSLRLRRLGLGARSVLSVVATIAAASSGLALSSCGPAAFDSQTFIDGVRILSSSSTEPYAKPGDTVTVTMLAVDGRGASPTNAPMKTFWVPLVCDDPTDDLYYNCFAPGVGSSGPGNGSGTAGFSTILKPGVDLTSVLPAGPSYTFTMPADVLTKHAPVTGTTPYGLVVLFNAACAGHLEYVPPSSSSPQGGIPLGCYDDQHNALGVDDFVFGLTRVYSYATITNANPVLTSVAYNGQTIADMNAGVTIPVCTKAKRSECDDQKFDLTVPDSSWEENPTDVDSQSGAVRHEEIYAAYFATFGDFDSAIRLLYDPVTGKIDDTTEKFKAPTQAGDGTMWIVIHDNRGGAVWTTLPLHVR